MLEVLKTYMLATALAFTFFFPALVAEAQDEASYAAMNQRFLAGYLSPAAEKFQVATGNLAATLQAYCDNDTGGVEAALADSIEAAAGLMILHLPITQNNSRNARILFHPDPRDTGGRQLRRLLGGDVPFGDMSGKSVALRGLGTLDRLFSRLNEQRACALAATVAVDLHETAEEISAAVPAFTQTVLNPGPDNPLYRTHAEASAKIVGSLSTSVAALRDRTIGPMIGENAERSRWRSAPLRHSGATFDYLQAQIHSMTDLVAALELSSEGDIGTAKSNFSFEAANLERFLTSFDRSVEVVAAKEDSRQRLKAMVFGLNGLEQVSSAGLMQALGLKSGFNALDGD
jgi:predicted lipoprotein